MVTGKIQASKSIKYFEQTTQKWSSFSEGVRDANNMWLDQEVISPCQRIGDYVLYIQITCPVLGDEHQFYVMISIGCEIFQDKLVLS